MPEIVISTEKETAFYEWLRERAPAPIIDTRSSNSESERGAVAVFEVDGEILIRHRYFQSGSYLNRNVVSRGLAERLVEEGIIPGFGDEAGRVIERRS